MPKAKQRELSEPELRDMRKGRHGVVLLDGRKTAVSSLEAVASRLEQSGAQVWLVDAWTDRGGDWVLHSGTDALPTVLLLRNGRLVAKLHATDVTGKHFGRKAGSWLE